MALEWKEVRGAKGSIMEGILIAYQAEACGMNYATSAEVLSTKFGVTVPCNFSMWNDAGVVNAVAKDLAQARELCEQHHAETKLIEDGQVLLIESQSTNRAEP